MNGDVNRDVDPDVSPEVAQKSETAPGAARDGVLAALSALDRRILTRWVALLATELEAAARELDGLRAAMQSRAAIEQAKGILMSLHSYDEQAAFAELVRMSQATQIKVRDVATRLVAQVSQPASQAHVGEVIDLTGRQRGAWRAG